MSCTLPLLVTGTGSRYVVFWQYVVTSKRLFHSLKVYAHKFWKLRKGRVKVSIFPISFVPTECNIWVRVGGSVRSLLHSFSLRAAAPTTPICSSIHSEFSQVTKRSFYLSILSLKIVDAWLSYLCHYRQHLFPTSVATLISVRRLFDPHKRYLWLGATPRLGRYCVLVVRRQQRRLISQVRVA